MIYANRRHNNPKFPDSNSNNTHLWMRWFWNRYMTSWQVPILFLFLFFHRWGCRQLTLANRRSLPPFNRLSDGRHYVVIKKALPLTRRGVYVQLFVICCFFPSVLCRYIWQRRLQWANHSDVVSLMSVWMCSVREGAFYSEIMLAVLVDAW